MAAGPLEYAVESFFSKLSEKFVDWGLELFTGKKKDLKSRLDTLQTSLNILIEKECDINKEIRLGEQLGKKKRKREVENWLKEVQKIESELGVLQNQMQEAGFFSQIFGEDRVSGLNARVRTLIDQSHHFGELLLDASEMKGEPLMLTSPLIGEEFEKNIGVIWKRLVIDKVKSIGIYGMGGVGKTTLAMHINNRLLKETQLSVYWITVSQKFTVEKLQSDLAKVMDVDLSDVNNVNQRAWRLKEALSQKESVLILDDVWSDIDLEKMGNPLGVEGCRLIVTTRSLNECQRIDCREIIEVKTLQTDESWTLFRETLGERIGEWMGKTSGVEEIAKSLAKECDGLPLGIKVLANSMKGVPTYIHVWRNVYDEICKLEEMEEKVFRVLKYSFDRLDPKFHEKRRRRRNGYTNLQLCFLYCSLYPEDYEINKDELVRRFISEELVDTRKSWEKQLDQGYTMLSKLVDLCLLESTGDDSECVKMHDLVRDMALSIATESPKYKVFAGRALEEIPNEGEWTEDVDKISLMRNGIQKIPPKMAPNCPKLATLLLNENPLDSIPKSFFTKMSGLRILDLSHTSIRKLPNSLSDLESLNSLLLNNCVHLVSLPFMGKLKALRELDLSRTSITRLPNSISDLESVYRLCLRDCHRLAFVPFLGKLKTLRELDLSGTSIKEIPKGIENLIHLEILLFSGSKYLKLQRGDLPIKSRNLQHLEFPLEIEVPVHEIDSFKQLKRFVGRFKDISDFNWFQSQTGGLISKFDYIVTKKFENVPEELPPDPSNRLLMEGCRLRREEEDSVIILPEKVSTLWIMRCKGLSGRVLDDFKQCSSSFIETLMIGNCEGIESIWNINDQLMAETRVNVASLDLNILPDLKCLVNWEEGGLGRLPCPPPQAVMIFSSLEKLTIYHCDKMKKLGLPLPCIHNITNIEVLNCREIEELIELDEEISEPTHSLPRLKELTLSNLPKLKSICKSRIDCKSIEEISIDMCPSVKKLGLCLHNIKSILVDSCREIEELIELDEDYEEISEPTHSLPRLRKLTLSNLPKLKSICKSRSHCESIEEISIDTCPSVKKLGLCLHNIESIADRNCIIELDEDYEEISEPTHSLPNLKWLYLKSLPKLKSICKSRIDCKSIKAISIDTCPSVKNLGLPLPCLHNIISIAVRNCGEIEELIELDEDYEEISEPTHSLPNLKWLSLSDLPKLKSICKSRIDCKSIEVIYIDTCPSVKKLGLCLHNVTRIEVRSCGEIEELIELDEDYEEPTHSLPELYELSLFDLPKLKSICKARIDSKSIEKIWIWGCPRVKKLPLFLPSSSDGGVINYSPPPALTEIGIEKELWESLEWDDDIRHKHLLQPFVRFDKPIF